MIVPNISTVEKLISQILAIPKTPKPNLLGVYQALIKSGAKNYNDAGNITNNPDHPDPQDWYNGRVSQELDKYVGNQNPNFMPTIPSPQLFSDNYLKDMDGPLPPYNAVIPRNPMDSFTGYTGKPT